MFSLSEIAQLLKVDYQGDGQAVFSGIASLEKATASDVAFYDNPHYHDGLLKTKAGVVILNAKSANDVGATPSTVSTMKTSSSVEL